MNKRMKRMVKECVGFIDQLFGDTTVPQKETVEALEEVKQEIEDRLATIGEDDTGN